MSIEVWITIGVIFVIVWGFIIRDIINAPMMSDDYGAEENPKTGFYNGESDEWTNTDNKSNKGNSNDKNR